MKPAVILESLYDNVRTTEATKTKPSNYILINLYTMESEFLPAEEVEEATMDLKLVKGAKKVWSGEEYIVIEL